MLIALLLFLQVISPPVGVEVYRSEKGLNANAMYGVLVDPNGFVWVHTDNGLYRYDGNTFKVVPSTVGREVVLANLVDSTTIAALSFDNSIELIDIRRISFSETLVIPDSIKLNSFASTVRRFGDTLYVGTSERRVLRRVGDRWENFVAETDRHILERFIHVDHVGASAFFTSSIGVWEIEDSELVPTDTTIQLTSKITNQFGKRWISGRRSMYRFENGRYESFVTLQELGLKGFVNQLVWRSENELWIASQTDGLVVAERDSSGIWKTKTLMRSSDISGLAIDSSGTIWVTTLHQGLFKYNSWFDRFEYHNPIAGESNGKVMFASENVYVTEFSGAFSRVGNTSQWKTILDGVIHYADMIGRDSLILGQLLSSWIWTERGLSSNLQQVVKSGGASLQPPIKHAHSYRNLLSLASPNGVYIIDMKTETLVRKYEKRATSSLILDRERIVIGRPDRLEIRSIVDGRMIREFSIPVSMILGLDHTRVLVSGPSNTLMVIDTENFETHSVFRSTQLVNASWESIYRLSDSRFAAVGSLGLFIFTLDSTMRLETLSEVPMTSPGLAQSIRHLWKDQSGAIWISTSQGAYKMTYDEVIKPIPSAFIKLAEVRIDGIEYEMKDLFDVPSTTQRISISLATFGYLNPRLYSTEYRIMTDTTWVALSQPSIDIESIRKGRTTFQFRLRNVLTDEVVSTASLVVNKQPHWWERGWVIALGVLFLLTATVVLTIRVQHRVLQRRIERIAQEDRVRELERVAVTRLLTSHYLFNALATIRSVARRSTDEVNWYIGRLSKVIRALIDRTSQNEVDLQSELDWIRDYVALESVGRQLPIEIKLTIDDDLDPAELYLPAFILQPVVENAMFHGAMKEAPVIHCDVRKVDDRLHIFIRNRIGAESPPAESATSSSRGLQFMAERLKGWGRYHGYDFGTDDVLSIRNSESEWSTEIRLPFINHDLPLVNRT